MTRSGMIPGAQHHLARKKIIIRAVDLFFCCLCIKTWLDLVWQIAAFDPDPTVKEKVIIYRKLFIALFFQQFCWLLWDSVNTVSITTNSYKTKPMPSFVSLVMTRLLRDPGMFRDPGIFSKSRSWDSQKSNPGIFQDFQKPLNDWIPRLSTPFIDHNNLFWYL